MSHIALLKEFAVTSGVPPTSAQVEVPIPAPAPVPAPGQPPATAPPATAPPAPAPPPPAEGSTRPKKKIKLSVTDFKMAKCFIGHKKLVNEVIITYWVRTTALRQIFTHTLWLMSVFNSMHPTTGGCRSKHYSIYFNGTEAR